MANNRLQLLQLASQVLDHQYISIQDTGTGIPIENDGKFTDSLSKFSPSFQKSISDCCGLLLKWETNEEFSESGMVKDEEDLGYIFGRLDIWDFDSMLSSMEGIVYFEDEPEDSELRNFHMVDYYSDENFVGIFSGDSATDSLYYFNIDDPYPVYLGLDLQGYVDMALAAKAFIHWPVALSDYLSDTESHSMKIMKQYLPILFPDWTWEGWIAMYEEIKLKD
jgi:hypothetical protein